MRHARLERREGPPGGEQRGLVVAFVQLLLQHAARGVVGRATHVGVAADRIVPIASVRHCVRLCATRTAAREAMLAAQQLPPALRRPREWHVAVAQLLSSCHRRNERYAHAHANVAEDAVGRAAVIDQRGTRVAAHADGIHPLCVQDRKLVGAERTKQCNHIGGSGARRKEATQPLDHPADLSIDFRSRAGRHRIEACTICTHLMRGRRLHVSSYFCCCHRVMPTPQASPCEQRRAYPPKDRALTTPFIQKAQWRV